LTGISHSQNGEAAGLDAAFMERAIALAATVRRKVSPNPWVGAVIVAKGEVVGEGATSPPGGAHAEIAALKQARGAAKGATCYVTLEPCCHEGRTGSCVDALISAGITRVVIATTDPDEQVSGKGIEALRAAHLDVSLGMCQKMVESQLAPYLKHRRTHRPYVVLKLAMSLDGRIAAPDGTSKFITGIPAQNDAHELRADSDAILVGANTVRVDDPSLTVRLEDGNGASDAAVRDPLRVVLGKAAKGARVAPCLELSGNLGDILDDLGGRGVLQLLVEGGAHVAHGFHRAALVDHYVFYLAPALFGGDDALGAFAGKGAATLEEMFRGSITAITRLGEDLRIDLKARAS